jgi:hypothetical protein
VIHAHHLYFPLHLSRATRSSDSSGRFLSFPRPHPSRRQSRESLLLGEVLALVGSVNGVLALLPAGGADLSVLVGELEGLDDSDGLLDGSTDGEVVDVRGSEGTLGVDEEGASESNALLGEEDAVGLGDGVVSVGELEAGMRNVEEGESGAQGE